MREPQESDLDWRVRMEVKLDMVVAEVTHLKRRASFWGAVSSIAVAVGSQFLGCV